MIDQSPQARIRQLELEKQQLLDENDVLKSALIEPAQLPREWGLTATQAGIVRVLLKRQLASKEALMAALYSDRANSPEPNILGVLIHRIRAKLRPFGIEIKTVWGLGYEIDEATRSKFKERQEP